MKLTSETILALAPDSASAANARRLASPARWPALHQGDGLLWGRCQGSGQAPYLTGVDLHGLVGKCSCPSRKFPCKHALALLLLSVTHLDAFGHEAAPEVLTEWQRGRAARAAEEAPAAPKKEGSAQAQAKRRAAREHKVSLGLEALSLFLQDLVRDGLAQAAARPYSDWDTQAARLVDAQAPGAARLVRRLPELLGDPAALLIHLGRLALLCTAWTRRAALSAAEQADLRAALGFSLTQADWAGEPVAGLWAVMGQRLQQDDDLTTRFTWLRLGTQDALLLDFAPPGRPLPPGLPLGQRVEAELAFAPSAAPQRAVLRGEVGALAPLDEVCPVGLNDLLDRHAQALALNPWLERSAHLLGPVWLLPPGQLVDDSGTVPLAGDETLWLDLLARGGGEALTLFGEWDGHAFWPLSLLGVQALVPLGRLSP
ncbi:SWIM zinc finger family protein [Deinococcus hohokamensis]|uniref:SWIM zinc finger family protein n=1 Tax=Deinococcus hohokamensis TaxID=309883 RepID=A0ABV9I6Y2_9DEIO